MLMVSLTLATHTENGNELRMEKAERGIFLEWKPKYLKRIKMISLDDNEYDRDIKQINQRLETMNSYLTALTEISSLTYLTSLSTLTAYANDITSIKYDTYNLSTKFNNYLLSSETSSLTFNTSVLNDYLKQSDSSGLTCDWKGVPTSTLNNYLLSSKTEELTCEWKGIPTSTLNNYLLSSNYVSFDSSVLNDYLLSSDYVSFDSSVLNDYLLSSNYVSFDSSVLNDYLLSSKTSDFAGSSIERMSTLSSLTYLTSLSNTPYMIDANMDNPNLYLYNVSSMSFFNNGTIKGNYSMGDIVQREVSSNWMNSYDHLLDLENMTGCNFHFEYTDSVHDWSYTNRRVGFSGRSFYNNTFERLSTISAYILSSNKISTLNQLNADYAYFNTLFGVYNMDVNRLLTNTFESYIFNVSFRSATGNKFTGVSYIQGGVAESCSFNECDSINIYGRAEKCSFSNSIYELYMRNASSCSGFAYNCTIYKAEKNYLTARSFTVGSASSCTFQTCDSINFNALYAPQLWAPHYLKGGTISGGSVTGDNLVMDVGYIGGLYMGHVCRATVSFTSMGNPITIASAAYPQDIIISYCPHPNLLSTSTWYIYLSSDLKSSFTLHIHNIQNVQLSYQSLFISQFLCLDCLGPRGVFSAGSYYYASLAAYCPTSRLSYNGVPWAAILH